MSIASEIERLNGAKSAISAAIAEKGVTVPDGTKIDGMALLVAAIKAKLQEKSATPSTSEQEIFPDSGYDGLSKVTVDAIPSATQATPTISVSSSGLITASSTQSEGYVEAGTKSATKQLTTQAAQTITPGTSNKTISSGRYLTGTQTIKGDSNLKAANIKKGVSIFGVAGSFEGGDLNIAKGTFVLSYSQSLYKNPVTVSGLSFTPKFVLVMYGDPNDNTSFYTSHGYSSLYRLIAINSLEPTKAACIKHSDTNLTMYGYSDGFNLSIISGGFKLTAASSDYVLYSSNSYRYIAIG